MGQKRDRCLIRNEYRGHGTGACVGGGGRGVTETVLVLGVTAWCEREDARVDTDRAVVARSLDARDGHRRDLPELLRVVLLLRGLQRGGRLVRRAGQPHRQPARKPHRKLHRKLHRQPTTTTIKTSLNTRPQNKLTI